MFTLAHVTDWHATDPRGGGFLPLCGKRFFGWLSWTLRRGQLHSPDVLSALFEDLKAQQPDHVAVTGDLTNIALPGEFRQAAEQLAQLGDPSWVSVVPGNHDAYVRVAPERSWDRWAAYMLPDGVNSQKAPTHADYPVLRVREDVAIVSVCSAVPTAWFQAAGRIGARQLEVLEPLLARLGDEGRFRVVLVHHPPLDAGTSTRRQLRDSKALREVLARSGAELVLHGHRHRTRIGELPGPEAAIPVVGARSSTDIGQQEEKRAQYHLYRIEREGADRWRLQLAVRGWDPQKRCFVAEGERVF